MTDPRSQSIDPEDLLTESSSDELNDLVKQFEAKYEQLRKKKELRKKQKEEEHEVHGNASPIEKMPPSIHIRHNKTATDNESTTSDLETIRKAVKIPQIEKTPPASPVKTSKNPVSNGKPLQSYNQVTNVKAPIKASTFINKLYETNATNQARKLQSIDYSNRKFEFEGINDITSLNKESEETEAYSHYHLRKRYIDHKDVTKFLKGITELKLLKIDKLLAKVHKGNHYAEPMYTNWCFVGFIISKSEPKTTKDKKSKYMKLTVGDFTRSIDLMLFGKAFDQYWKLSAGSLIMVLNPYISKFSLGEEGGNGKSGFTLQLNDHHLNSLMEIGSVRDFGLCTFVRKTDNSRCTNVIDTSKAVLCDFHLDFKYKKSGRMELNGSVQMKSPQKTKTSVYLKGGAHGNGGYIQYANENTTVYENNTGGRIDSKKYYNPSILQTEAKRRKLQVEKSNQLLEKQLSKLSQNSKFHELHLTKTRQRATEDVNKAVELKKRGFSHNMISKIGFDPTTNTAKGQDASFKSPTRRRQEHDRVRELYELSNAKSKSRTLQSSTEDRQSKVSKWQSNIKNLKQYEQTRRNNGSLGNPFMDTRPMSQSTFPQHNTKKDELPDQFNSDFDDTDDDDDDDIHIEFDTEEMKHAYLNKVGKNG
ncbi:required for S-phase initiation or completion [Scheffersomyces xylosifermentans]|uniref:required for S-phase initiation or completion n=1 Tax=Scheffersomyces xylosifermentans TaxID=1304137 RepID=UPI00315C961A